MLELLKCSLVLGGPFEDCPLPGKVMQRLRLNVKVANECAVVASEAAAGAYFCDATWSGPRSNSSHFLWVTLDALCADDMTKKRNLALKKTTFRRL